MTAPKAEVAKTADKETKELSEQWLELIRTGEGTLAETLREFVETVQRVVPRVGVAKQREIINSGLEMAQAIARAQYNAVRSMARSVVVVNVEVDTDVDVDVDVASPRGDELAEPKSE
jgi:predicted transcriptional regulator